MTFPKLSTIDKAFLMVLAGILSVGIVIQAGSSFSGVQNTFGFDEGTGEGYIEVLDLNVSRDWFRGLVNVTDNILFGGAQIIGTVNQTTITDNGDGTFTISLPQDINTTSTPIFYGIIANWNSTFYDDVFINETNRVEFRTPAEYISSQIDGWIHLTARSAIWVDAPYLFFPTNVRAQFRTSSIHIRSDGNNELDITAPLNIDLNTDNVRLFTTDRIQFRDAQIYIVSDSDGRFDIYSDVSVDLNAPDFQMRDGGFFSTTNLDDTRVIFRARLNGVGRREIARMQSAVDAYFAFGGGEEFKFFESGNLNVSDVNIWPETNNTANIGDNVLRFANIWGTTITGKSLVTGSVIETEIGPAPWETFEEGDLVKIYDSEYFVKTSKMLDYVVGVVMNNPQQIVDHYDRGWELVEEQVPVTKEVEYFLNRTDAYNITWEVIETRIETVREYYLNPVEETLLDGSKIMVYYNESRIVYESVSRNVSTEIPVYKSKGNPVLCVAGKARVKISEPVLAHDILVAGKNGVARPFRTVLAHIKAQYSGITFNWNNVIDVMEAFNLRMLGEVMEASDGEYCWVMLW